MIKIILAYILFFQSIAFSTVNVQSFTGKTYRPYNISNSCSLEVLSTDKKNVIKLRSVISVEQYEMTGGSCTQIAWHCNGQEKSFYCNEKTGRCSDGTKPIVILERDNTFKVLMDNDMWTSYFISSSPETHWVCHN